jgi:predicted cobalt transporter CbtA
MALQLRRRITRQGPFLAVFAVLVAAVLYLTFQPRHWERGTGVVAVAMLLAAVLRATLPNATAGLLAVRGRWWDVPIYSALGVAILVVDLRLKH